MDMSQNIPSEDEIYFSTHGQGMLAIQESLKRLRQIALDSTSAEPPVLLSGEIGVGVENLARLIHQGSRRSAQSYHVFHWNPALSEVDIHRHLFGEEKQTYNQKLVLHGIFEQAREGTVFIESVDKLSNSIQNKIIQAMQSGKFHRTEGTQEIPFDVRLIAGTYSDSSFLKSDLFPLISKVVIEIPLLRKRTQEILPLAKLLAAYHFNRTNKIFVGFTPQTENALIAYSWPGNTDELNCVLWRAALTQNGNEFIHLDEIETKRGQTGSAVSFSPGVISEKETYSSLKKKWSDTFEKNYLVNILKQHRGNVSAAAREARLDRSNFLRLMRRHGIRSELFRSSQPSMQAESGLKAA
jgi:DNA-binding NtrC family response regulator